MRPPCSRLRPPCARSCARLRQSRRANGGSPHPGRVLCWLHITFGSDEQRVLQTRARSNGYSTTVSVEGNRLMNERVYHHCVVQGVRRDAQTSAPRSHTSVHILWCVLKSDEQRVTETGSMNERVYHRCVVQGVRRDAQTSAPRSHTSVHILWCVLKSDEQRVTETGSE